MCLLVGSGTGVGGGVGGVDTKQGSSHSDAINFKRV